MCMCMGRYRDHAHYWVPALVVCFLPEEVDVGKQDEIVVMMQFFVCFLGDFGRSNY